jgi:hypothetical protein
MKLNRAKKTGIPAPNRLGSPVSAPCHPRTLSARIVGSVTKIHNERLAIKAFSAAIVAEQADSAAWRSAADA